jgi:hypothetical protein
MTSIAQGYFTRAHIGPGTEMLAFMWFVDEMESVTRYRFSQYLNTVKVIHANSHAAATWRLINDPSQMNRLKYIQSQILSTLYDCI